MKTNTKTTRRLVKKWAQQAGVLDPLGELVGRVQGFSLTRLARNLGYRIKGAPDHLPLPPPHLIYLTIGSTDISAFLDSGKVHAHTVIQGTLEKNGLSLENYHDILDFGCGCGRVMRFWASLKNARFYGVDYNPVLVEWCKRNLPFAKYGVNKVEPPLQYQSGKFDLIYARSVFTHLTETLEIQWLRELERILKPGGTLLFTVSGRAYFPWMTDTEIEGFNSGDLVIRAPSQAGRTRCAAFHPESHVSHIVSRCQFEVVDFVPGKAEPYLYQDTYLVSKRSESG